MSDTANTEENELSLFEGIDLKELTLDILDPNSGERSLLDEIRDSLKRGEAWDSFRRLKASSEKSITWKVPGSDFDELPWECMAFQGVLVDVHHGLLQFDSENKRVICQTVAAQPGTQMLPSPGPLPSPMYGPTAYQKTEEGEPVPVPKPDQTVLRWNTIGSRGFSCTECVQRGLHVTPYVDDKGEAKAHQCRGTTTLFFVVTHLAEAVPNHIQKRKDVLWHSVKSITTRTGERIFPGPFVLAVGISPMPATRYLGANLQIKTEPKSAVPAEAQTWKPFLEKLYKEPGLTQPHSSARHTYFMTPIQMWSAQPTEEIAVKLTDMTKSIPVFYIPPADEMEANKTDVKMTTQQLVSLAHKVYQSAFLEAGGQMEAGWPITSRKVGELKSVDEVYPSLQGIKQASLPAAEATVEATTVISQEPPPAAKVEPAAEQTLEPSAPQLARNPFDGSEDSNPANGTNGNGTPNGLPVIFSRSSK